MSTLFVTRPFSVLFQDRDRQLVTLLVIFTFCDISFTDRAILGEGTTVLKCIPGVKFPKYIYTLIQFNTPKNIFLILSPKFERDSYFTPTAL